MWDISTWAWVTIPLAYIYFRHQRRVMRHNEIMRIGGAASGSDTENARLRDEVRALKERIAVLERIATEDAPAKALDREIEKLR
ncbi:MAG: hypothetical protein KGJ05_08565 [Alphaproteobacteria bacterium]|nr:hypothetical protein [Alphaproteobacteria bacterium]MDE2341337.1 hypothetical protein [Alphaproteobacteria bacterium]